MGRRVRFASAGDEFDGPCVRGLASQQEPSVRVKTQPVEVNEALQIYNMKYCMPELYGNAEEKMDIHTKHGLIPHIIVSLLN